MFSVFQSLSLIPLTVFNFKIGKYEQIFCSLLLIFVTLTETQDKLKFYSLIEIKQSSLHTSSFMIYYVPLSFISTGFVCIYNETFITLFPSLKIIILLFCKKYIEVNYLMRNTFASIDTWTRNQICFSASLLTITLFSQNALSRIESFQRFC